MQRSTAAPIVTKTTGAQLRSRAAGMRSPVLREARLDDYGQITSLTTEYGFTPQRTFEEWHHLWLSNPAYLRVQGDWPMGWVLETEGHIVGHFGNIPSTYELGERQLVCASGYAWVVASEFRGYSLLLLDNHIQQKSADFVMSNTANLQSFQAHTQLGAIKVPVGAWDQTSAWITSYPPLLSDWLGRRNIPGGNLLSYPLAIVLSAKDMWNRMLLAAHARRGVKLELCTDFDERFDEFWVELRRRYQHKLLAVRARSTLEWHFHYSLREKRIWIFTLSEKARLLAYAIFLLPKGKPGEPINRMYLADYQSLDHDDSVYHTILQSAVKRGRQAGIHLISTVGFSASGTDASTLAPYRTTLKSWTFLYKASDSPLAKVLADPQIWSPSPYDGEASLS
jgi:hypothetical protein